MNQQSKLKKYWKSKGFFVINLVRVTPTGIPDLIAIKPNKVVFIESKEDNDTLKPNQRIRLNMLTKLGFECYLNYDIWNTSK
jgi:Holliday junction resolvase